MLEATQQTLIEDLAIVIVCAAAVSFVFHRFKLPVILGYLLAGLIVGPNSFYQSFISNEASIRDLSELGVVFLMFYIGLEFDLRKLKQVMGSAFTAVLLQTMAMIFLGMLTAPLLGWSGVNGLFLGGVLAISSTMVTFSVLREQGALNKPHAQMAIGMLILEDIVAILLLVILTGVANTGKFSWVAMWQNVFLVGVFVMMVFYLGKLIVPSILNRLQRFGSDELTSLVVVGLLLGIGIIAKRFEFSIALGAFLAGAILSQSSLVEQIEHTTEPLRNLFNAVFFVTIGMLIEPMNLVCSWLPIVIIAFLVIFGKALTVIIGLFLAGQNPRTSFQAAMCKSQVGEFSFIIAALGEDLGVVDSGLNTLAVGVALITILLTPLLHAKSEPMYNFFSSRMPDTCRQFGRTYTNILKNAREHLSKSTFLGLVRQPIFRVLGYFLLFNGIIGLAYIVASYIDSHDALAAYAPWPNVGVWVLAGCTSLPFLSAVIRGLDTVLTLITEATFSSSSLRHFASGRMRNVFHNFLLCFVLIIFGGIYLSAAASYLPSGVAMGGFVVLTLGVGIFFWKTMVKINSRLEYLFIDSLDRQTKDIDEQRRQQAMQQISDRYPWPVSLSHVTIEDRTVACGRRIIDLDLRARTGASVISLSRGAYTIYDPDPSTPLFPGDHLILIGQDSEVGQAISILKETTKDDDGVRAAVNVQWDKIYLAADSPLVGETLAGANLRRQYHVNVVGIQRGEERNISPKPDDLLLAGDLLLLVGGRRHLDIFKEKFG